MILGDRDIFKALKYEHIRKLACPCGDSAPFFSEENTEMDHLPFVVHCCASACYALYH